MALVRFFFLLFLNSEACFRSERVISAIYRRYRNSPPHRCCLLFLSLGLLYFGRSPAFGELSDTHFFRFLVGSREDRKAMWGEAPIVPEEIFETFASYIEGKIPKLVR